MIQIRGLFKFKNKYFEKAFIIFILGTLSFMIMVITLMFASPIWNISMPLFRSYFESFQLLLMNYIPIFLFMTIVYLLSNRLWVGFLATSFIFVSFSIVNKFKLTYRDEPFIFMDMKLIKESLEMTNSYEFAFSLNMIIMIIGLLLITLLLALLFNYKLSSKKIRLTLLIIVLIIATFIFKGPYFKYETYRNIGNKEIINIWSQPQQFQSKGFVYPFIYSITSARDKQLEGYDEKKAKETLSHYEYEDIPEDKKVNIIAIMLEAYNDFSKFESVEFGIDPYEYYHQLKEESIHGNLINNIFAGDTIQTERAFVTGYFNHPRYYVKTNSFVWYFNEQGYRTEAMHPIYGWFYNRRNSNPYIGFQSFDYYENKYKELQESFYEDKEFFNFIIEGFENSKANNTPYFNFSVTYQNHGPYSNKKYSENQFLKMKDGYNEETYNIINNYLAGISRTDEAMKKLIDYFQNEEEPTIILFFGDHNPWLGIDSVGYEMLDISLDFSNEEGFTNYYETPYIIWGNDSAKQVINNNIVGVGDEISPNFLMPELFKLLGWKGNEYIQYITEIKESIDVFNNVYFKEEGIYTMELSPMNQKMYEEYLNVEYYYSRNFKK